MLYFLLALTLVTIDYEGIKYGAMLLNSASDVGVFFGVLAAIIPLYVSVMIVAAVVNRYFVKRRRKNEKVVLNFPTSTV